MKDGYKDIIEREYYSSKKYPHMSIRDRAAQFAPFSALTGYDATVEEAGRRTNEKVELDEYEIECINRELTIAKKMIKHCPRINITFFIPDERKQGGVYKTLEDKIVEIDEYENTIVISSKLTIKIDNIYSLTLKI